MQSGGSYSCKTGHMRNLHVHLQPTRDLVIKYINRRCILLNVEMMGMNVLGQPNTCADFFPKVTEFYEASCKKK